MRYWLKNVLIALAVALIFLGVMMWTVRIAPGTPPAFFRYLPIAMVVIGAGVIGFVILAQFKPSRAPDILRRHFKRIWEAGGVHIAMKIDFDGQHTWLEIWYQNRFDRPCVCTFDMTGRGKAKPIGPLHIEFLVEGAEVGIVRRALIVPGKLIGRKIQLDVVGDTHFPHGRGELLRFRERTRISSADRKNQLWITLGALASGPVGLIALLATHTTLIKLTVPADVQPTSEPLPEDEIEILWTQHDQSGDSISPASQG